jgi:hypothetical protein
LACARRAEFRADARDVAGAGRKCGPGRATDTDQRRQLYPRELIQQRSWCHPPLRFAFRGDWLALMPPNAVKYLALLCASPRSRARRRHISCRSCRWPHEGRDKVAELDGSGELARNVARPQPVITALASARSTPTDSASSQYLLRTTPLALSTERSNRRMGVYTETLSKTGYIRGDELG